MIFRVFVKPSKWLSSDEITFHCYVTLASIFQDEHSVRKSKECLLSSLQDVLSVSLSLRFSNVKNANAKRNKESGREKFFRATERNK